MITTMGIVKILRAQISYIS